MKRDEKLLKRLKEITDEIKPESTRQDLSIILNKLSSLVLWAGCTEREIIEKVRQQVEILHKATFTDETPEAFKERINKGVKNGCRGASYTTWLGWGYSAHPKFGWPIYRRGELQLSERQSPKKYKSVTAEEKREILKRITPGGPMAAMKAIADAGKQKEVTVCPVFVFLPSADVIKRR